MPFSDPYKKYQKPSDNPAYINPSDVINQAVENLPPQERAVGKLGLAGMEAAVTPNPTDLLPIAGAKSAIRIISDAMSRVEGAGAGFLGYNPPPNEPYKIGDAMQAAKSGFKRSASHQEWAGPTAGVLFDIASPVSGMAGEGLGVVARAVGVPILRTGMYAAGKAVPEGVKDVAALVNKPYAYQRMGIPEGLNIESEYAGRMHQADLMKRTVANKEIRRLVPDAEKAKQLAMAVEDGKMEGLDAAQMQAYPLAQREKDLLEQRRIAGQTTSAETAAGLEAKMNAEGGNQVQYFPHMDLPPQERIDSLKNAIADKKATGGDTAALESMLEQAKWDAKSRVGKWMAGKRARPRGFQNERTDLRTLRQKGDSLAKMNVDVADALHMGRVETAKAEAARGYMMDYIDAIKRKPEGDTWVSTPTEGYTKIDPKYPGMPDNFYVRDDIHKTIMGTIQHIANPEAGMLTGIAVFDAANRLWRNWNLFTRSATLMNNFIGNVFNNYARLGMGLESVNDYAQTASLLGRKRAGTLDLNAPSFVKGYTNGQLSDLMERERITGTGWSHEVGYQRGGEKTVGEKIKGIAGPESFLLEPGKAGFTLIEDWNRAAAYINQLKKGFDPRTAARNVFDSMFDYELGLTTTEKDVMRRIVPFYSWTRFNLPLQLRMFAQHPERYVNMARLERGVSIATSGRNPNEDGMAEWQRQSLPMPIGTDAKKGTHMLPLSNIAPAAQAADVITNRNPYSALSGVFPTLMPFAEAAGNIDLQRSSPRHIVNIQSKPGEKENLLGKNIDKRASFLAKEIPPIRMAEQARVEYQKAGGGIKGVEAAVKRLALPYSFYVNPSDNAKYAGKRAKGELKDWKDYRRKQWRAMNEADTADKRSAAEVNFNKADEIIRQLETQGGTNAGSQ